MPSSMIAHACAVSVVAFASSTFALSIAPLQAFPGGSYTSGFGINGDGSIVVGYGGFPSSPSIEQAARWGFAGVPQGLGKLSGGNYSAAHGVSSAGDVAVGFSDSSDGERAIRWTDAAGLQDLGVLAGDVRSRARAVSGDGRVVVGESANTSASRAFRWTESEGMTPIPSLPGATAYSVNHDGTVIVGTSSTGAFRWVDGGGVQSLGTLGVGIASALGVSADGSTVVGNYSRSDGTGRAFKWTSATSMVDLGALPGGRHSTANSVNADGSMVVGYGDNGVDGMGNQALLWTSSAGLVNLNAFLPTIGVDLTGWHLSIAWAVSADGSAITGIGTFNGQERGWVVRGVPMPSSIMLGMMAVTPLARRRRCNATR